MRGILPQVRCRHQDHRRVASDQRRTAEAVICHRLPVPSAISRWRSAPIEPVHCRRHLAAKAQCRPRTLRSTRRTCDMKRSLVDTRNRAIAKLRLLFVQPEDLLAPSTRQALLNLGIDSVRVPDGAEALRALARQSFTAAIVDIGLPDFRGTELARHFRVRNSTLPLLLC